MKNTIFSILMILAILILLAVSGSAQSKNEKSGSQVEWLRVVVKQLNANVPVAEQVTADQFVVIDNIDIFFKEHNIVDVNVQNNLRKMEAFVANYKFPVYINTDLRADPTHPSFKNTIIEFFRNDATVTAFAATLRHEAMHARGEKDEAVTFAAQIEYLEMMQKKGKFNVPTATAYIAFLKNIREKILAEEKGAEARFGITASK